MRAEARYARARYARRGPTYVSSLTTIATRPQPPQNINDVQRPGCHDPQPGKRRYGSRAPALERTSSAHIDGWRRCGSFVGVPRCNHHTGCPMAPGRTGLLRSVHPTLHPPLLLPHPRLKPHVWDRRSLSAFSKGSSSIRSALIPHPPPPPSTPCPPNRPEGSHISTSTPSTSASMPTCLLLL